MARARATTPPRAHYNPYKRPWPYGEPIAYSPHAPPQQPAYQPPPQPPVYPSADLAQIQQLAIQQLAQQAPTAVQPQQQQIRSQSPLPASPGPSGQAAAQGSPVRPRPTREDIQRKKATSACGKCAEVGHWHSDGLCRPEMIMFKGLRDQVLKLALTCFIDLFIT